MALPLALLSYLTPPFLKISSGALVPNDAGFLSTLVAGTSTNKATYVDKDGSVAHANPIVLDSAGWPNTADDEIYVLPGGYTLKLYDSANDPANPGSVPYREITYFSDLGATSFQGFGNILSEGTKGISASPYAVTATDYTNTIDTATNPFIYNLPAATTRGTATATSNGGLLVVLNISATAVVRVTPNGTDTINSNYLATTYVAVNAGKGMMLWSNGSNAWYGMVFSLGSTWT